MALKIRWRSRFDLRWAAVWLTRRSKPVRLRTSDAGRASAVLALKGRKNNSLRSNTFLLKRFTLHLSKLRASSLLLNWVSQTAAQRRSN
jgi:hypothetical protein